MSIRRQRIFARTEQVIHISIFAAVVFLIAPVSASSDSSVCEPSNHSYGVFDYTNPKHVRENLPVVEQYHFWREIETLEEYSPDDLNYVLGAFPNHHRALHTMIRYFVERIPKGAQRLPHTAECYFDRALMVAPNDPAVYMLESIYLHRIGKTQKALATIDRAVALSPSSAEIRYNAGVIYARSEKYDVALEHARVAYELGYPLRGLKNMLIRAGVWIKDSDPIVVKE